MTEQEFNDLIASFEAELQAFAEAVGAGVKTYTDGEIATLLAAHNVDKAALEASIANVQSQVDGNDADIAQLFSDLAAEVARAEAAEAANAAEIVRVEAKVDADKVELEGQINGLEASLVDEVNTRTQEIADLTAAIDFVKENTDPAAIDSLTEIIAAFESADSDLNAAISQLSSDRAAALNDFITNTYNVKVAEVEASISENATAISDEQARAEAAELVLTNDLASEVTRAETAESDLQGQIDAVVADLGTSNGDFTSEIARVEGVIADAETAQGVVNTSVDNKINSLYSAISGIDSTSLIASFNAGLNPA